MKLLKNKKGFNDIYIISILMFMFLTIGYAPPPIHILRANVIQNTNRKNTKKVSNHVGKSPNVQKNILPTEIKTSNAWV